jgi:peptidyl-prolyl cis-trans isomerase SurA
MRRLRQRGGRMACIALVNLCLSSMLFAQASTLPSKQSPETPAEQKPIVLDHVVAIINGEVILESDVREEMRFAALQPISVPAGQNTAMRAAQRLVSRMLILRQMREQNQVNYSISDEDLKKSLDEVKQQLPICRQMHCETEEGWQSFLKAYRLTDQEVNTRWRQRLEILKFIQTRFGSGIRIPRHDIENYYKTNVVPAFDKLKQKPPALEGVSDRIREILLQQQVNSLLRDWLQSLRDQGSVQIIDPAYGQSISSEDEDTGGGS